MFYQKISALDLSLFVQLNKERYPFLLESSAHSDNNNYDILFAFPERSILGNQASFLTNIPPLQKVDNPHNLPFIGGYFIYLGYELATEIEPILVQSLPSSELPNAYLVEINSGIIYNHHTQTTTIFSDNKEHFELIKEDSKQLPTLDIVTIPLKIAPPDAQRFTAMVRRCKEYIVQGDIFQANLSHKWQGILAKDIGAIDIYHKLRAVNPAPFSAFADFAGFQIISSSPERLFSVHKNSIQTRPIAGTRPRGNEKTDTLLKQELRENFKEQAEHIMLLDLERNDLGRVCNYGSIIVNEIMAIESYEFVHHIVSNIKGELKPDISFADIVHALFPGGTITGCPKIRSMQIIAELEQQPRDAYTGSLGYISKCGAMDFNILIRTITQQQNNITLSAGAGIVYDSDPERELAETRHKARGMLKVFN